MIKIYEEYIDDSIYSKKAIELLPIEMRSHMGLSDYGIDYIQVKRNDRFNIFLISTFSKIKSQTELTGCAILLRSPFEYDPELRKIKILKHLIKSNTIRISLSFLFGICNKEKLNKNEDLYIDKYFDNVNDLYKKSKTIGDIIDGLNKLIEKILIELDSEKFGL